MNSVTVYTTNRCPYCVMLKNFLADQHISFKEVNVETSPGMMDYVVSKTGQLGVPQTEINGKWILGYDPQNIMLALKK